MLINTPTIARIEFVSIPCSRQSGHTQTPRCQQVAAAAKRRHSEHLGTAPHVLEVMKVDEED